MSSALTNPTNATKAQVIAVVNALLVVVTAFGFDLSGDQVAAVTAAVNALFSLWVGLTYKDSPKRISNASDERMERLVKK